MILERITDEREKVERLLQDIEDLKPHEDHAAHALSDLIMRHQNYHAELLFLLFLLLPSMSMKGDMELNSEENFNCWAIQEVFRTPKEAYLN